MAKKIVMGYWDCKYCGTKKIKGTYQDCQYCGATRGTDTKFYMSGPVEYLNEEDAERKGKGADWLCAYCDTLNSTLDSSCNRCGASRSDSSKDYFQLQKEKENKILEEKRHKAELERSYREDNYSSSNNSMTYKNTSYKGTSYKSSYKNSVSKASYNDSNDDISGNTNYSLFQNIFEFLKENIGMLAGIIGAIAFIGLLVMLLIPKEETLVVTNTAWEYDIRVESYETVRESDWDLPTGARLAYTEEEIQSYVTVLDHYETKTRTYTEQEISGYTTEYSYSDNGDGTFTETSYQVPQYTTVTKTETYEEPVYRQDPVYATKYYYDIDKWIYKRTVTTQGNDRQPYWGDLNLRSNEREGGRSEHYYIIAYIADDENMVEQRYEVDKVRWQETNIGNELRVKISLGQIVEFE